MLGPSVRDAFSALAVSWRPSQQPAWSRHDWFSESTCSCRQPPL